MGHIIANVVMEIAHLRVRQGMERRFEGAFQEFQGALAAAQGFHGAELLKAVERPEEYWLMVRWETVEAHTVDFKNAGGWARWDQLVGPWLAAPADAVHGEVCAQVEGGA